MRIAYEEDAGRAPPPAEASEEQSRAARKSAFLAAVKAKRAAQPGAGSASTPKAYAGPRVKMPQDLEDGTGEFAGIDDLIRALPSNYSFEPKKSVWRLRESHVSVVALQFPEGLLVYSCLLSDIFRKYAGVDTIVLGDVTYGACCVDDFTAKSLGADFLIHYGHSCLVNVADTAIGVQYVFVDIAFDATHLVETIRFNFDPSKRLAIVGTIQYASSFHRAHQTLLATHPHVFVPQALPLSGGELLGCTSPKLPSDTDAIVYVADGRFHLESVMIANPTVPAYQYDVNNKRFTREEYAHSAMMTARAAAIEAARGARCVGLILGTLGRQGSLKIFERLKARIAATGRTLVVVLMSEITPRKLALMADVECWVQIACPRLSIDWGGGFSKPLLNPYEAEVAFGEQPFLAVYPMDYYARNGGTWTNYFGQ